MVTFKDEARDLSPYFNKHKERQKQPNNNNDIEIHDNENESNNSNHNDIEIQDVQNCNENENDNHSNLTTITDIKNMSNKLTGEWNVYYVNYQAKNDKIHTYSMEMMFDEKSYDIHGCSKTNKSWAFKLKGKLHKTIEVKMDDDNDEMMLNQQHVFEYQMIEKETYRVYNAHCIFDGNCKLTNGEWYDPQLPSTFGYFAAFKTSYQINQEEKEQLKVTFELQKSAKYKQNKLRNKNTRSLLSFFFFFALSA